MGAVDQKFSWYGIGCMTRGVVICTIALICLSVSKCFAVSKYATVIHYDQKNGFPASNGYVIYQDRQGYIWMSTENGLVQFNGHEFKLWTMKDGLPDNELFALNEDRFGRLWFAPFTNNVGYINDNKVHHCGNDSALRGLKFKNRPERILFDKDDNTFFCERNTITCLSKNGKVTRTTLFNEDKLHVSHHISSLGKIQVVHHYTVYEFNNKKFRLAEQLSRGYSNYKVADYPNSVTQPYDRFHVWCITTFGQAAGLSFAKKTLATDLDFFIKESEIHDKVNVTYQISADQIVLGKKDGLFFVDVNSGYITDTLLFGYNVGSCIISADGSLWVGTMNSGIFRFIQSKISTAPASKGKSIQYLQAIRGGVLSVFPPSMYVIEQFDSRGNLRVKDSVNVAFNYGLYAIHYIKKNMSGSWIVAMGSIFLTTKLNKKHSSSIFTSSKEVYEEDEKHLLIASVRPLVRIDKDSFIVKDTLFKKRTTSVTKIGETIYAGTLQGLWAGSSSQTFTQVCSNVPSLQGHITKLAKSDNGIVWVANNKAELTGVFNQKPVALITAKDGLQCNRISAIEPTTNIIWLGTDNGLFAIQNKPPYNIIRHLTYASGLNSNQVNCMDVYDGKVWVGTNEGINYFDEQAVFQELPALKMNINGIENGDQSIKFSTGEMLLAQKSLAIDFDVIDHYGGIKPIFQYKLNTDTNWTTIENSNLFFPDIPYGKFVVRLRALSPNWKNPAHQVLTFYKSYPFYLKWWFFTILAIMIVATLLVITAAFIKRTRKKDQEKILIQRNLLQLEQLALQGQMNPHFIFNCITAIKQNYNAGDVERANTFVDVFTALIRQTFEMIVETFVQLDRELNYLNQYILVEQARFDYSFDFSINANVSLPKDRIPVPAMMLQPLVENAIRHGIRHLSSSERRGKITIEVNQDGDTIQIILSDNGVGRAKSKQFGKFLHQMQVNSTMVNAKRIDILNKLFNNQIIHRTDDLTDADGNITGTRVIVSYPLNIQNEP